MRIAIVVIPVLILVSSCYSIRNNIAIREDEKVREELRCYKERLDKDLDIKIDMPETISREQKETKIFLLLTNISSDSIMIEKPEFTWNTEVSFSFEGEPYPVAHPWLERRVYIPLKDRTVLIRAGETKEIFVTIVKYFIWPLDSIPAGKYSAYLELEQIDDTILRSDTVDFVVK